MAVNSNNDLLVYLQNEYLNGNVYIALDPYKRVQYKIDNDGSVFCVLNVINEFSEEMKSSFLVLEYENLLNILTVVEYVEVVLLTLDANSPIQKKNYSIQSKQAMAIFLKASGKEYPMAPVWQGEKAFVIPFYMPKKWQGRNSVFQDMLRKVDEPLVNAKYPIRETHYSKMIEASFQLTLDHMCHGRFKNVYENQMISLLMNLYPNAVFGPEFPSLMYEITEAILAMIPESNGVYLKQHTEDVRTYQYGSGFAIHVDNRLTSVSSVYYIHLSSFPLNAMDFNSYYDELTSHFSNIDELFFIIFSNAYIFPYKYQGSDEFEKQFKELENKERELLGL